MYLFSDESDDKIKYICDVGNKFRDYAQGFGAIELDDREKLSPYNYFRDVLSRIMDESSVNQQPLNVGDEALPSFRESQEAGFLQLKYMFPLLIIASENDVRFPLTEQQELQNLSENLIFARQHLTKVRTNSSNESY